MKLNELTGIKNLPKLPELKKHRIGADLEFKRHIKSLLKNAGFTYINEGAFGLTFKGKNSVLKVFANDPAYEEYIKFSKSLPHEFKSFAPKITSVRYYPQNPNIKFVKMPIYYKVLSNNFNKIVTVFKLIASIGKRKNLKFNNFKNSEELKEFILNNFDLTEKVTNYISNLTDKEIILFNFIVYMSNKNPNEEKFLDDINSENIMQDKQGNYILIDPWATLEGLSEI